MKKLILNRTQIPPNPTLEFVTKLVESVIGEKYTEVISIGGGSTIDCGKYVALKLNIPHTAIPTTAGTGSEVTKYAVFIDKGKKISLEDPRLIPDAFILDASRIVSLPPKQTAASGLDALSQGIESYWSKYATDESRRYSKIAIRLASKHLYSSFQYPNSETLRKNMLMAAHYSGKAINITKTTICHAISYPLTIHYGIPHGIACAHTLPFFMRYFGFRMIDPKIVERLIIGIKAKILTPFDKELVAREALISQRVHNCTIRVTKDIILQAL